MDNKYKHTDTTESYIRYHLIFCPRYRRKIFEIDGVEKRFKELTTAECKIRNIEILAMECQTDHVHMFISVYPKQSIQDVVKQIKGATSHKLREEFPQLENMPSLWTRSYFISTEDCISPEAIKWYVNKQRTRS